MGKLLLAFLLLLSVEAAFAGEKEECLKRKNSTWVKGHYRKGYYNSKGTHVKPAYVNAYCRGYSEKEIRLLAKLKEGPIKGWPNAKKERFKGWNDEEKEKVLEILKELPKNLLKGLNPEYYRANESVIKGNIASSAPTVEKIVLYDGAFYITSNLRDVIIHELAHLIYINRLSSSDRDHYQNTAGWKGGRFSKEREKFVKEDGMLSPEEDFANNVESYFSKEKEVEKTNPAIYKWINTYFEN